MTTTRLETESPRQAVFYLIGAVFFFSTSGVLIKLSSWPALALNGGRSFVAALFFLAVVGRPKTKWTPIKVGGAVAYVATLLTFVMATQLTTAANAVFLQFTAPIWVALLSIWLLKEMPRRSDLIFMVIVLSGMGLFFADELTPAGMTGNLIAIFSGICFAFMITLLSKERAGSPLEIVLLGNILSGLVGLPSLLQQRWEWREVLIVLVLGLFQLGFPFLLYNVALRRLRALEIMLIQSLEPILNPIWVYLVVAELPTPMALLGSAIVFLAVTGRAYATIREHKEALR